MTANNEKDSATTVVATFSYNSNLMLDALREFLRTLHEGGVDPKGEQIKYTLSGYLVEALAVTIATSTYVGDGEDYAHIIANHAFKRVTERMHEKWYHDLKEEALAKRQEDDEVDLSEIAPQGQA
ncbi:hypothetical protein MTBLM1_130002 [Rhodospirillaceae bacterium LM-1]|nr:hypothetical protein MTBLM1_130002 [Rhodospirillaceae bacterium LM-1]